ncbi:MAG: cysteine peptidase family C39 domain-containing protein [Verrucomicrobiota bacterium]
MERVCLQSTSSTCGAASGATILKALGVEVTESQLAAEAHSYMGGTEAWYLARALRKRGVTVRFRHGEGLDAEVNFPAIAGVRLGKVGHFIAILGKEGELFQIGDPLRGEESLAAEDLLKRYGFTGFYMEVGRLEQ